MTRVGSIAGEAAHGGASAGGTEAGAAGRRTAERAVGDGPLHLRGDEHRGELDALVAAIAVAAAAGVDLVAVVLVVGDPVDVVQRPVVAAQGVVIVVPEALQALFLRRQAGAVGEDVPPGLITAV